MRNVTTYTNEEVVAALMEYHRKRMPFNERRFTAQPDPRLDYDSGTWTVVIEENPKEVKVGVNIFKAAWAKIKEIAAW